MKQVWFWICWVLVAVGYLGVLLICAASDVCRAAWRAGIGAVTRLYRAGYRYVTAVYRAVGDFARGRDGEDWHQ